MIYAENRSYLLLLLLLFMVNNFLFFFFYRYNGTQNHVADHLVRRSGSNRLRLQSAIREYTSRIVIHHEYCPT